MSLLAEFKKFAMRGSVVDLAVGVIIGASFTGIITSLVRCADAARRPGCWAVWTSRISSHGAQGRSQRGNPGRGQGRQGRHPQLRTVHRAVINFVIGVAFLLLPLRG